jgi:hypothetical protein
MKLCGIPHTKSQCSCPVKGASRGPGRGGEVESNCDEYDKDECEIS